MAEDTKIEWADHTFNPWTGCTKVSTEATGGGGCDHCYAEAWAKRSGTVTWGAGEPRRRTTIANWRLPLKWDANHAAFFIKHGRRQRVFCASLADVFDNEVDPAWRRDLFDLIRATQHLDWLLLTKRIGNAQRLFGECHLDPPDGGSGYDWPANVWLGATIVNQPEADRDLDKLQAIPAAAHFVSYEPALGPLNLNRWLLAEHGRRLIGARRGIDWVIAGGESGPKARPAHPDWFRSLRDQCAAAGVAFLFKQLGEWAPLDDLAPYPGDRLAQTARGFIDTDRNGVQRIGPMVMRYGKKAAGRRLDGVEHNGFPKEVA